jgi:hypothetical protein
MREEGSIQERLEKLEHEIEVERKTQIREEEMLNSLHNHVSSNADQEYVGLFQLISCFCRVRSRISLQKGLRIDKNP